ncbi:MAG TPA: TOMM precursor leader peptide-binding protein [Acidimicrobiales bacterium]|nr:TOMM precursor leader peptide-binding protein [Acidimicrobiales bacterium]
MALVGDPAWRVVADEGHLVVTAGADAVWLLEDVPASVADVVARYWSDAPPADVPAEARPVVEHLAGLGALRPAALSAAPTSVGLVVVGSPLPAFADALGAADGVADLTIVLRTNAPLRALIDVAADLRSPHVLCDVAFHHSIVLGPHVVPGDTACLACLAGRVGTRWGDPEPPAEPRAAADAALAAALTRRLLANQHDGGAPLVNATVTFDLLTFATRREPLWRSSACAVCADWPDDGRLSLPWA